MAENYFGTNHTTVEASAITTGQIAVGTAPASLTSETGPLTHGVLLAAIDGSDYYANTFDGLPEVATTNGMLFSSARPLFIPILDPSVIRIVCSDNSKTLSYIMC